MTIALDPAELSPEACHKLSIGTVVPRPIAWTSTVDEEGRVNLAPFSYFMACHSYVPALALSIGSRGGRPKDSRANIMATGEFVVNLVNPSLLPAMNLSAADFPPDVDEAAVAGLTMVPSVKVRPPRVADSPIQIECRVLHALDLGEPPRVSTLFVGQILMWHLREDLLGPDYKVDQAGIQAVARMGGPFYTVASDPFALQIPDWRQVLPDHPLAATPRPKAEGQG